MGATSGSALATSRERFLAGDARGTERFVRPEILASWRRSLMYGVRPDGAIPQLQIDQEAQHALVHAATPVIERHRGNLKTFRAAITLTDTNGRLIDRLVEDRGFARRLDSRHVLPGRCIAETVIGTNSCGMSLETGQPAIVSGYEHFSDGAVTMTTAGAPIKHPITRRIVGSINVTCGVTDAHPLMLGWVTTLAREIQDALVAQSSQRKRALLDAFLNYPHDARHPLVCLDSETIITNAAASRMLDASDHALLWEIAARQLDGSSVRRQGICLAAGQVVDVDTRPVFDGRRARGVVLRLTVRPDTPRRVRTESLDATNVLAIAGLVGRSEAWMEFVTETRAALASGAPLLLSGEAGTGKSAVLDGLVDPATTVIDATGCEVVAALRAALGVDRGRVRIDRLDRLPGEELSDVLRIVAAKAPDGPQVVATASVASRELGGLLDWPGTVVHVPPIRDRLDDLPELLATMTRRIATGQACPRWSAEAMQVLGRISWPANLRSLENVVQSVCKQVTGPTILARDLPPEFAAMATRRTLAGLEQVEAHAISAALRASGGNKREAANALGIARSTLYRKVRTLGLDLSRATY